jgi:hypothetical protein
MAGEGAAGAACGDGAKGGRGTGPGVAAGACGGGATGAIGGGTGSASGLACQTWLHLLQRTFRPSGGITAAVS